MSAIWYAFVACCQLFDEPEVFYVGAVITSASVDMAARFLILLDSGAAVSICNDEHQFGGSLRPTQHACITASGKRVRFQGVGTAWGLPRVYYMPSATSSLISLADLMEDNKISEESPDCLVFRSRLDGAETWRFTMHNRLWELAAEDAAVHSVFTMQPVDGAKAMLLHRRLGHASLQQMRALVSKNLVDGLQGTRLSDLPTTLPYCPSCALGKIRRLPFLKVNPHRSTVPGAGWHVDIIVLRTPCIEGGKYFLLFTDDATRTWVGYVL